MFCFLEIRHRSSLLQKGTGSSSSKWTPLESSGAQNAPRQTSRTHLPVGQSKFSPFIIFIEHSFQSTKFYYDELFIPNLINTFCEAFISLSCRQHVLCGTKRCGKYFISNLFYRINSPQSTSGYV